eukprot:280187-Rhodomonas_salina.1
MEAVWGRGSELGHDARLERKVPTRGAIAAVSASSPVLLMAVLSWVRRMMMMMGTRMVMMMKKKSKKKKMVVVELPAGTRTFTVAQSNVQVAQPGT